mmetsp:Transcript_53463/g.148149  ORF Transcript_53463/g.148149 Transcript_53463/m.148149 type:complete len:245 (-) Transcript_53463:77-811(-)
MAVAVGRGSCRHTPFAAAMAACLGCFLLLPSCQRFLCWRSFVGPHRSGRGRFEARDARVTLQAEVETSSSLEPLKLASAGMGLLKPAFAVEARLQAFGYDRAATRAALKAEAKSAPVVVYTYSLSPFCAEATKLLDSLGAEYKEVVLAPEWFLMLGEGAAKRAELLALFGRSSMPHIFIGGRSIGGLTEGEPGLVPLYEAGELEATLKQVGALPADDTPFGFFLYSGDKPKVKCYGSEFCEPVD